MNADFFEIEKQLDGYDWWIWLCFGDRSYGPNKIDYGISLSTGLSYIILCLALMVYHIWPNEGFSVFYVFFALSITLFCTFETANEYVIEMVSFIILGGAFWFCDPTWGFEINNYHFESFLYAEMFAGGCIGLSRRIWNAVIWRELIRIRINVQGATSE